MSGVLDLVRADLREFAGYASARRSGVAGTVWLNANESPWPSPADGGLGLNRYPDPQPAALRAGLAALYAVAEECVLLTRGSDEAIDLLVRALCQAGRDAVVVAPPTFGMYAVCARLQDARRVEVPLLDAADGWMLDIDAVIASARDGGARIVFLCSPNNPTGEIVPREAIARAAVALADQAVVVVDEAYGEYAGQDSAATLLPRHPNLAVLRTLSKAHALAGARIGALLADPALVRVLRNVAAPYPLPTPSVRAALAALQPPVLAETRARIAGVVAERERVHAALSALPGVRRCYPSQGNFLLVRFDDAETVFRRLLSTGVVVRDMRGNPRLDDALRISIGTVQDNDALLAALGAGRTAA